MKSQVLLGRGVNYTVCYIPQLWRGEWWTSMSVCVCVCIREVQPACVCAHVCTNTYLPDWISSYLKPGAGIPWWLSGCVIPFLISLFSRCLRFLQGSSRWKFFFRRVGGVAGGWSVGMLGGHVEYAVSNCKIVRFCLLIRCWNGVVAKVCRCWILHLQMYAVRQRLINSPCIIQHVYIIH